jgi:hypothetical protein
MYIREVIDSPFFRTYGVLLLEDKSEVIEVIRRHSLRLLGAESSKTNASIFNEMRDLVGSNKSVATTFV